MTKKTGIILAIGTFSMLFLSVVGYFGIKYIIDRDFQENTIQCSNDTEKRRESLKDKKIVVYENFYSKKLKTCLIIGHDRTTQNGELVNISYIIKELYTGKELNSFIIANSYQEEEIIRNYNNNKITELTGITEENLKNICSSNDKNNPLRKYCSLTKYLDGQEKWKITIETYR